jgi:ABC-type branched-subunit amino acid transport system ATPase component
VEHVSSLLAVTDLTKAFGTAPALDRCSLAVEAGTITGLIGPNGSGKTTLLNIVTGQLAADAGRVEFAGQDITGHRGRPLYRQGLSRTYQEARVFGGLSVRENLIAAGGNRWVHLFTQRFRRADRDNADRLLDEFRLRPLAEAPAGELPYGQRKLVEFGTVLMGAPRLVLLDEPTAGVHPDLVAVMERHIRQLHAGGVTFLIVEHDTKFVLRLCDPVIVLDAGRPIFTGSPAEVRDSRLVQNAYFGTTGR